MKVNGELLVEKVPEPEPVVEEKPAEPVVEEKPAEPAVEEKPADEKKEGDS